MLLRPSLEPHTEPRCRTHLSSRVLTAPAPVFLIPPPTAPPLWPLHCSSIRDSSPGTVQPPPTAPPPERVVTLCILCIQLTRNSSDQLYFLRQQEPQMQGAACGRSQGILLSTGCSSMQARRGLLRVVIRPVKCMLSSAPLEMRIPRPRSHLWRCSKQTASS